MMTQQTGQAVDFASELEQLAEQHRQYRTLAALPDALPSSQENREQLAEVLRELKATEQRGVTDVDALVADTAAVMASVVESGDGNFAQLTALQHALVLSLESGLGRSNTVQLQNVVRFMLAHAEEKYEPVTRKSIGGSRYDVFTDSSKKKVVLLEQEGSKMYTAELKTPYTLNRVLDDFENYRNGTSREAILLGNTWAGCGLVLGLIGGIAAGFGLGNLVYDGLLTIPSDYYIAMSREAIQAKDSAFNWALGTGILTTIVSFLTGGFIGEKFDDKAKAKALAPERLPYNSITSGYRALLDAFSITNTFSAGEAESERTAESVSYAQRVSRAEGLKNS